MKQWTENWIRGAVNRKLNRTRARGAVNQKKASSEPTYQKVNQVRSKRDSEPKTEPDPKQRGIELETEVNWTQEDLEQIREQETEPKWNSYISEPDPNQRNWEKKIQSNRNNRKK